MIFMLYIIVFLVFPLFLFTVLNFMIRYFLQTHNFVKFYPSLHLLLGRKLPFMLLLKMSVQLKIKHNF